MKRLLVRLAIVIVSAGWIAPLTFSFWALYDFIWNVVWPLVAFDKVHVTSFHPVQIADELFYFSMAWLALVIMGWTLRLTRSRS